MVSGEVVKRNRGMKTMRKQNMDHYHSPLITHVDTTPCLYSKESLNAISCLEMEHAIGYAGHCATGGHRPIAAGTGRVRDRAKTHGTGQAGHPEETCGIAQ